MVQGHGQAVYSYYAAPEHSPASWHCSRCHPIKVCGGLAEPHTGVPGSEAISWSLPWGLHSLCLR